MGCKHTRVVSVGMMPPYGIKLSSGEVVVGCDYFLRQAHLCPVEHVECADSVEGPWVPWHSNARYVRERAAPPPCKHEAVDVGMRRSWCRHCDHPMIFEGFEWREDARRQA